MDLPAWREENLAKRQIKNDKKKKMKIFLDQVVWREKGRKRFEKVLDPSKELFLKTSHTIFD